MRRRIILLVVCISALILLINNAQLLKLFQQPDPSQNLQKVFDPANAPLYKKYHFDNSENVINIGIQPFWTPGIITEVMKRDQLLNNALKKLGMRINFYSFFKGADVNYFFQQGDLDAGVGGDMPAISLCAKQKIVITSLIEKSYASILSKSIVTTSDLKGKSISFPYGSVGHRMLLTLMAANNLDENDVDMIPLDVNEMPRALKNNVIDAFVSWEPVLTLALLENPKYLVVARGVTEAYLYFSEAFEKKHSKAVMEILASQIRSMEWLRLDKSNLKLASQWLISEMNEMTGELPKLSEEDLSTIALEGLLETSSMGKIVDRSLKTNGRLFQQFKFLQSVGEIEASTSWQMIKDCFTQSYIDQILLSKPQFQINSFALESESQADE